MARMPAKIKFFEFELQYLHESFTELNMQYISLSRNVLAMFCAICSFVSEAEPISLVEDTTPNY